MEAQQDGQMNNLELRNVDGCYGLIAHRTVLQVPNEVETCQL